MGPTDRSDSLVTAAWLAERLDEPSLRIVDARFELRRTESGGFESVPQRAAYEAGHIPGAVFLNPVRELSDPDEPTSVLSPARFEALMGRLGIDTATTVIAYDQTGGTWCARLWWALRYYGHDDVRILDGGYPAWLAGGFPIEAGVVNPPNASFRAQPRPALRVTADDVQAAIEQAEVCLVDALPAPVYQAQHIPGAVNVPAPANLDPDTGCLRDPDSLAQLWAAVPRGPGRKVISYCGAGVYASFALFALHLLGHDEAALYDGSWAEWAGDPSRPVAKGSA